MCCIFLGLNSNLMVKFIATCFKKFSVNLQISKNKTSCKITINLYKFNTSPTDFFPFETNLIFSKCILQTHVAKNSRLLIYLH